MTLRELEEARMKVENIEDFKEIVEEAIKYEGKFREHGDWLDERYTDRTDHRGTCYRAKIVCINETYNDEYRYFRHGFKDVSSITCYDIFYTDITGGGFVVSEVTIDHNAIKAIKKLGRR